MMINFKKLKEIYDNSICPLCGEDTLLTEDKKICGNRKCQNSPKYECAHHLFTGMPGGLMKCYNCNKIWMDKSVQ